MIRLPHGCLVWLALLLPFACSQKTSPPAGDGGSEEPFTKCEDDGDCRLSCDAADDCCTQSCNCEQARHYDDHNALVEKRGNMCQTFDYTKCPQQDCSTRDYAVLAKCERHKCTAVKVKREPPPAPIDTSKFDRACSADSDCTVVNPQPCAKCGCADEPIAVKAQEKFNDAMGKVECPPYDPWPDIDCGSCIGFEAYCDNGTCESRQQQ